MRRLFSGFDGCCVFGCDCKGAVDRWDAGLLGWESGTESADGIGLEGRHDCSVVL